VVALVVATAWPAGAAQLPLPPDASDPTPAQRRPAPAQPSAKIRVAEIEQTIGLLESWLAKHRDKEAEEPTDQERAAALVQVQLEMAYAQDRWLARAGAIVDALQRQIEEQKLVAARDDIPSIVKLQRRVLQRRRAIYERREKIRAEMEPQIRRQLAVGLGTDQPIGGAQVLMAIDALKQDKAVLEGDQEQE
jgi:hypothetical protein